MRAGKWAPARRSVIRKGANANFGDSSEINETTRSLFTLEPDLYAFRNLVLILRTCAVDNNLHRFG